jgi:hypothetical protein
MERDQPARAEAHGITAVLGMLTEALAIVDKHPSLPPDIGARLQEVIDSIEQQGPEDRIIQPKG